MTTVDYARRRRRILLTGWLLGIGSIVAAIWVSVTWLSPSPPRSIGIAADAEMVGFTELADRYRAFLARDASHASPG